MLTVCRSTTARIAFFCAAALASAGCATGNSDEPDTGPRHDGGARDAGDAGGGDTGIKPDGGMDADLPDVGPVCVDGDGDGFGANCTGGPDCDDTNASVSPAGTEVCNGINDDCDASTDEGLDVPVFCGVGACRHSVPQCMSGATTTCTPLTPSAEVCDGIDNNCDGTTDEGFGAMTCGIGACQVTVAACMGGTPPACVPTAPTAETCNGVDDDCNTVIDDGLGMVSCGMGACRRSVAACTAGAPGACVPGMPASESCNGIDDNCDGVIDDGFGLITCGVGACRVMTPACVSGTPMSCTAGTPHAETCNGIDDDCNGMLDDGLGNLACGVGACLRTPAACVSGSPQPCVAGTPAASETCGNSIDDNCNGSIDEGCSTCTPPANTTCASAIAYSIGSAVMGDNTCSAPDTTGSCGGGGNDSTYRFTADGSATRYTITMTGPAGYDTVLHAHSSTTCSAADELACNDDAGSVNVSTIQVDSPPSGNVYLVADSLFTTGSSTFSMTSSTTSLVNDTCATAIPIHANGVYHGSTSGRANDYMPTCAFAGISSAPDVVYTLLARATRSITVSLCGSSYDSVVMVGTSCGASNTACNDDNSGCSPQSSVTFTATNGTTYYITIDGYSSNAGPYTMTISGY